MWSAARTYKQTGNQTGRMKTAVVILNWNGERFLKKFLPGLLDSVKDRDAEVIVADNASTDSSMVLMLYDFPRVKTIRFNKNYGFTGGYNRALFQTDARYYVLINSDIEVTEGWLDPLVDWMDSHPDCGVCAPKLHSYQDRDMFEYAGAAGGLLDRFGYPFCRGRVLKKVEKDCGQYDTPADVFWASGACMMVRADLYRKLGGLDERFFAHQEEIDLCWRAQLEGYKVETVPFSTVYHVGGGTLPNNSPWKLYLNYRNNLLMLSKNLAATYALEYFLGSMQAYGQPEKKSVKTVNDPREAAVKGAGKARKTIFWRMVLDGCSAAVYLLTFRFRYFSSVIRAHRDFRRLRQPPDTAGIADFLVNKETSVTIHGFYRKWIVPRAFLGIRPRI